MRESAAQQTPELRVIEPGSIDTQNAICVGWCECEKHKSCPMNKLRELAKEAKDNLRLVSGASPAAATTDKAAMRIEDFRSGGSGETKRSEQTQRSGTNDQPSTDERRIFSWSDASACCRQRT